MRALPIVLLFACTGESSVEKIPNTAPTVQITSHEDGAELQEGYSVQFRAQLSDDDNEFEVYQKDVGFVNPIIPVGPLLDDVEDCILDADHCYFVLSI